MGIEATGAPIEVSGTKYLAYDPWWGDLNNVRLCFENVAVLAFMLDRTIILSPRHRQATEAEHDGNGDYRPLHPGHFLDLGGLRAISMPLGRPATSNTYVLPKFEPDTVVLALSEPGKDITAFAGGRAVIRFPREARDAQVVSLPRLLTPFYAQIYAGPHARRAMAVFVREWVRHYPQSEAIARRIVAKSLREPFHSVVVRRNEFIRFYPQSNIPIDQIEAVVAERARPGSLLLVATDEVDRAFFLPLAKRFRCVFARDLVKGVAPDHFTKWQISCIEQNLCALGESFVGTRLSTFSGYVHRLRGYLGAADDSVRFTDMSHHRVKDDEGAPTFSWEATRNHGEPLWAREFFEGWR